MHLFTTIGRELFREKTRIVLTILAIAWGTFAIASMLAIGEGLRITFAQTMANVGHNLLTVEGEATAKSFQGIPINSPIKLTNKDLESLRNLPNIEAITPKYQFEYSFRHGSKFLTESVNAVNDDYAKIHTISIEPGGRFLSFFDMQHRLSVVVLGTKTAEDLFRKNENPVGKVISVNNKPFLVVGVMAHKPELAAHEGSDDFLNWIPLSTYELIANPQFISAIDITYQDLAKLPELKAHIKQVIALNHGADPEDDNVVHFTDFSVREEKVNNFFIGMQIFLGLIGVLTLVIAGVGIANVMFAAINRATREIGVRMAVGARTYQIVMHYIFEAIFATFVGGLVGLGMSGLLVYGLRQIPMKGKLIDVIGQPKPVLSFMVISIVVLILGVIGFLAGLFPAIKASRIDPARALTYE